PCFNEVVAQRVLAASQRDRPHPAEPAPLEQLRILGITQKASEGGGYPIPNTITQSWLSTDPRRPVETFAAANAGHIGDHANPGRPEQPPRPMATRARPRRRQ